MNRRERLTLEVEDKWNPALEKANKTVDKAHTSTKGWWATLASHPIAKVISASWKLAEVLWKISIPISAAISGIKGFGSGLKEGLGLAAKFLGPIVAGFTALTMIAPKAIEALRWIYFGKGMVAKAALNSPIVQELKAIGSELLGIQQQVEKFKAVYRTVFGAAGGGAMYEAVKKKAAETPYQIPELTDVSGLLGSFEVKKEKILGYLTDIGDAASATGQDLQGIGYAFANATAGQLRGLKQIGITAGDIRRKMGEEIDASTNLGREKIAEAVSSIMKERFGGGMKRFMGTTITGLLSNIEDNIWQFKDKVGARLGDSFKAILSMVTKYIEDWRSGGIFDSLADNLGKPFEILANVLRPVLDTAVSLIPVIEKITKSPNWVRAWEKFATVLRIVVVDYLRDLEEKLGTVPDILSKAIKIIEKLPTYWNKFQLAIIYGQKTVTALIKLFYDLLPYIRTLIKATILWFEVQIKIKETYYVILGVIKLVIAAASLILAPLTMGISTLLVTLPLLNSAMSDLGKAAGLAVVDAAVGKVRKSFSDLSKDLDKTKNDLSNFEKTTGKLEIKKDQASSLKELVELSDKLGKNANQVSIAFENMGYWKGKDKIKSALYAMVDQFNDAGMEGMAGLVETYSTKLDAALNDKDRAKAAGEFFKGIKKEINIWMDSLPTDIQSKYKTLFDKVRADVKGAMTFEEVGTAVRKLSGPMMALSAESAKTLKALSGEVDLMKLLADKEKELEDRAATKLVNAQNVYDILVQENKLKDINIAKENVLGSTYSEQIQQGKDKIERIKKEKEALISTYEAWKNLNTITGTSNTQESKMQNLDYLQKIGSYTLDTNTAMMGQYDIQLKQLDAESAITNEKISRYSSDERYRGLQMQYLNESLGQERSKLDIMNKQLLTMRIGTDAYLKQRVVIEGQVSKLKQIKDTLRSINQADWMTTAFGLGRGLESALPQQGTRRVGYMPAGTYGNPTTVTLNLDLRDVRNLPEEVKKNVVPIIENHMYGSASATGEVVPI